MNQLTKREKEILKVYKKMNGSATHKEMADRLNVTVSTLTTLLSRIRKKTDVPKYIRFFGKETVYSMVMAIPYEWSMSKISEAFGKNRRFLHSRLDTLEKTNPDEALKVRKVLANRKREFMLAKDEQFLRTARSFSKNGKSVQDLSFATGYSYNSLSVKLAHMRIKYPEFAKSLDFQGNR